MAGDWTLRRGAAVSYITNELVHFVVSIKYIAFVVSMQMFSIFRYAMSLF